MNNTSPVPAQLDAIRLSETVRRRLVDFSLDTAFTSHEKIRDICRSLWSGEGPGEGLVSDLWVEGSFPSMPSTVTLRDLAAQGQFHEGLCQLLDDAGAFPADRVLYQHQAEVVGRVSSDSSGRRPAIVVSAGTGAGKTECFLLPILNDLFRSPRKGKGIQCLVLYPMNALVNDQVDRIYEWLRNQQEITLFHFTSETPENRRAADRAGIPEWAPCRFRTRDEARGREPRRATGQRAPHPPDILITNYSMLEYMLCRPQDRVFFGNALRAVILDEAHLYTGTLAAEITLLLRRLYARCDVDPAHVLQIATSATLGGDAQDELQHFASTIFSKDRHQVHVVIGRQHRVALGAEMPPARPVTPTEMCAVRWLDSPLLVADEMGKVSLRESPDESQRLSRELVRLTSAQGCTSERRPAAVLHSQLRHAPIIHQLQEILWQEKRLPLRTLSKRLWRCEDEESLDATITLLTLAASARTNPREFPLIPHRIHVVVRSPDGLSVCLNADCTAQERWKLPGLGGVVGGVMDRCPSCKCATLALARCNSCGAAVIAAKRDGLRYANPGVEWEDVVFFHLAPNGSEESLTVVRASDGEVTGSGTGETTLERVEACPACGESTEGFAPFASSDALCSAVVAETVLSELPKYPASHNAFLPARGRRLLAFSDSRREAARLGPRLQLQHEARLIRSAIYACLAKHTVQDEELITYLEERLAHLTQRRETVHSEAVLRQIEEESRSIRQKLQTAVAGGSAEEWAERLRNIPWLEELLDIESAQHHEVLRRSPGGKTRPWSQQDWESNAEQVRAKTLQLLAGELLVPNPRAMSLEMLGMAEITYPGIEQVRLPERILGRLRGEVGTKLEECWSDLLRSLCDTLRMDGCVTLGGSKSADLVYRLGGVPIRQWMAARHQGPYLRQWIGATDRQRRIRFVRAVLAECGCAPELAKELAPEILEATFLLLLAAARFPDGSGGELDWLLRDSRQSDGGAPVDALQIDFSKLGLRLPSQLYRCERTRRLWPRSVAGCAPETGCDGTLAPVTTQDLAEDPRVGRLRREYAESPIFRIGMWAEEHSAQLDPRENRRLQDLFRAGLRNILSATTTLELGIDIGGLAAVFLGNVPPGKANYLQRAGRAGRRSDGSAAVVTYARTRPYDQEVFRRFGDFLDRPLRKPTVFLDRERLPRRHFHAWLLGEFFLARSSGTEKKGAMDAFGKMGAFCGTPPVRFWRRGEPSPGDFPESPPEPSEADAFLVHLQGIRRGQLDVVQVARRLFWRTALESTMDDWSQLIDETIKSFQRSVRDWRQDFDRLYALWRESLAEANRSQANALWYQLRALAEVTVIEALADRQFLPRYGFPIGLHRLQVIVPEENDVDGVRRVYTRQEDQFRLERAGILSLAEYVPGTQLIAGGKQITSRGLLKHWSGLDLDDTPGLRGSLWKCERGHVHYEIGRMPDRCPICKASPRRAPESLLIVKHGFTTAAWDPPKWSTRTTYVGAPEMLTVTFREREATGTLLRRDFAGVRGLAARYREDGELLAYHRGGHSLGFAICLKCGYADSERHPIGQGRQRLPARFEFHAPLRSVNATDVCWSRDETPPVLRHQMLAARTTTDILMLDLSECLEVASQHRPTMWAIAYASHRAAAEMLELDSRELGVLLVPTGAMGESYGVVLYDSVPGGAGHVRELLEAGLEWLQRTRDVLFVSEDHDRVCISGCLDCLLSFEAQRAMTHESFDRRRALHVWSELLETVSH